MPKHRCRHSAHRGPAMASHKALCLRCDCCHQPAKSLMKCGVCKLKCCRKGSFWCSVKGCKHRICNFCQKEPDHTVHRVCGKWLCHDHRSATCWICAKDGLLDDCCDCLHYVCPIHCYTCCHEDCLYRLCSDCQQNKEIALTRRDEGWACSKH